MPVLDEDDGFLLVVEPDAPQIQRTSSGDSITEKYKIARDYYTAPFMPQIPLIGTPYPGAAPNLVLQEISCGAFGTSSDESLLTLRYATFGTTLSGEPNSAGEITDESIEFNTNVRSVHTRVDIFLEKIGTRGQGVDYFIPYQTIEPKLIMPIAAYSNRLGGWVDAVAKLNADPFIGFAAFQVLYLGFASSIRLSPSNQTVAHVTHKFERRPPNPSNEQLVPGITPWAEFWIEEDAETGAFDPGQGLGIWGYALLYEATDYGPIFL